MGSEWRKRVLPPWGEGPPKRALAQGLSCKKGSFNLRREKSSERREMRSKPESGAVVGKEEKEGPQIRKKGRKVSGGRKGRSNA